VKFLKNTIHPLRLNKLSTTLTNKISKRKVKKALKKKLLSLSNKNAP
jgi:hypothetical protein